MDRQYLIGLAKSAEAVSYSPPAIGGDGSPYKAFLAYHFLQESLLFFGDGNKWSGIQWVKQKVNQRLLNGEENADCSCANWWVWTVFKELNVSRV